MLESKPFQSIPVHSSNSRTFRRKWYWSSIARQRTVAKRIYRVHLSRWNASELNSIFGNGLILGGKGLKRGRQAVFFTTENENCMGETPRDSTKPRIAPYKNTWKRLQNTVCWCNLKLVQEKGLLFYRTRSHAIVLYNTLLAASIEKVVCMKTQDVRFTPRLPRVVFRSNTQCGVDPSLQDNVLLPGWLQRTHLPHRNAHEMHSIIKSELIPRGRSLRTDRQSVFFTAVNPMCARKDLVEDQYDLDKPRIAVC